MWPQGDLGSAWDIDRNRMGGFGEVGAADVHRGTLPITSHLWVLLQTAPSLWGCREDTAMGG